MTTTNTDISRPPDCDILAPLLALRETGMLDAHESMQIERHLAACATCQRDAELDDALAGSLRRALLPGAQAAPTLHLDEIQRAAEEEVIAVANSEAPEARPTGERRGFHLRSTAARWGSGLSALAAVLALILFATYLFGAGSSGMRRTAWPGPTPALSPLLSQQMVYLATETGIYALRASDSSLRWKYTAAATANGEPMITTMALGGGTLYALASSRDRSLQPVSTLLALDAHTGAVRWKETIPGQDHASLLQTGNLLIVSPYVEPQVFESESPFNQVVLAYSAATGQLQWERTLSEPPLSKPVAAGGAVYVATASQLIALDLSSGAVHWTTPIVPSASQEGTTPAPYNSAVALAAAGPYVFALASRDVWNGQTDSSETNLYEIAADGTHIWREGFEHESSSSGSTPTPVGSQLFAPVFGGLSAFSIGASPALQWRFILNGAPERDGTMMGAAFAGGVVYVTNVFNVMDNNVEYSRCATYAVRASDGAQLWRSQTYAAGGGAPVAGLGIVLTPSYGALLALRAANGQRLWKYPASGLLVGAIYAVQFG